MALKKTFSKDKKKCTVSFTVSPEAAQNAKTINIAGDFNSWSSTDTPMKKGKEGEFSVKLELDADKEYQFRYLIDGHKWENDWKADKYIPAPYSNADNSVVVTKVTADTAQSVKKEKK
jgi:1,4-alpha-glucan branching enzyme